MKYREIRGPGRETSASLRSENARWGRPGAGWRRRARRGGPRRTFTDLLRLLRPGGDPPDAASFAELWQALRRALVAELKRRGLWEAPPAYLGVYGAERWWSGEEGAADDPLEELTADAYAFIFVARLRALRAQLEVRDNVDGLVFLNVRHFLHDRQRAYDPLGYRIFEALREAVREAVAAGEMAVLEGDPRIRNETVLAFGAGGEPADPAEYDLPALVQGWNDELLPDLVTAHGRGRQPVLGGLRRKLRDLPGRGVEAIRFKDLVDPMKSDARARWAALLAGETVEIDAEAGAVAGLRRFVDPDRRLEDREAFRGLVDCISDVLESRSEPETSRRYLESLWGFLRSWAGGGTEDAELPSHRRLAAFLGIPRERLPELYDTLRRFAEECEARLAGRAAVLREGGSPAASRGDVRPS
jgi:hypothetical protein